MPHRCPCSWKDVVGKTCRCSALQVERYRHKISGPLLDRIDIHLHALPLKTRELVDAPSEESSTVIKDRTSKARQLQWKRFKGLPVLCNAHMESAHLRHFCTLSKEAKGIETFMGRTLNAYSNYFNLRHNRRGPLWQNRFGNRIILDIRGLNDRIQYVHYNPVKENLIKTPEEWPYSSACKPLHLPEV